MANFNKHNYFLYRHAERKKTWAQIGSERDKLDDIQNHAINSTQDVEKNPSDSAGRGRKRSKLQSRLKAKVKRLTLEHYNPILELDEIEIEFERWQNEHITLNIKSLSDFCNEKEKLAKEVFSIINKKEFKKLLPTNLQVSILYVYIILYITYNIPYIISFFI